MGGVCCPTLINNAALAEKFTSYFHGFYYKGFYTSLGVALSDFWQHGRLPTIDPGWGFLQQQNHKNMCVVSAQSASW